MAQYDVFTNPSRSAAEGIPYVVVIQSDLLDALVSAMDVVLSGVQLTPTERADSSMTDPVYCRLMAEYNAWMNRKLYE